MQCRDASRYIAHPLMAGVLLKALSTLLPLWCFSISILLRLERVGTKKGALEGIMTLVLKVFFPTLVCCCCWRALSEVKIMMKNILQGYGSEVELVWHRIKPFGNSSDLIVVAYRFVNLVRLNGKPLMEHWWSKCLMKASYRVFVQFLF